MTARRSPSVARSRRPAPRRPARSAPSRPRRARARGSRGSPVLPRIGYVLKVFPRLSETFVLNEILTLEELGFPITVFTLRPPKEETRHEQFARLRAEIIPVPRFTFGSFRRYLQENTREVGPYRGRFHEAIRALAESASDFSLEPFAESIFVAVEARRRGIDRLHAHFATIATNVSMLANRLAGIPYTFTAHAKDIYRHTVDPAAFATKVRHADRVITVCDANHAFLDERLSPALRRKVVTLYNGVDVRSFTPADRASRNGAVPLVLGVGRLVEKKGFADLVEACRILRDRGIPFRARIVGEGEERPALRERIRAHGLGRVVNLAGPRSSGEVREMLRRARAVALPCLVGKDGNRDALPTVLLEAAATGIPSVSTRVAGVPEIIDHGRTGFVVPQHRPRSVAAALARLLVDPARAARMGEAARTRALERFDIRTNVTRLGGFFGGPGPRRRRR